MSYTKALDRVLGPLGFVRDKKDWVRIRGDIWDCVNLQKSWIDGAVTVSLYGKDLETDRVLRSIECGVVLGVIPVAERIGILIDGYDRWWKNDPNGPLELSEAVREHAIPWFDRIQTLEDQASIWYSRTATGRPWGRQHLGELAITLFRLGAIDEALSFFDAPVPKTANPHTVATGRCVQRWLEGHKRSV
ncbi:DUF4304 domain-containing protein [Phenylobacterium sp.]|uniref:DUF4304 domain-containing protein n=1 Tax=Phenylobacterium sp. TaxID=1871053 RepID=UPI002734C4D1|nr:DUF4304 domain-containing protein [Phenylobacterium sp.]MDP3658602.1 DUF4304 domain-containing protein [Phenylobacterium sp.]